MMRDVNDDDLRRRYQATAPAGGDHVDEAMWERLACGELGPPDQMRVSEHITACAACGAVYRALTDLRGEAHRFDPGAPAAQAREPRSWLVSWAPALAAAAVLAIVVAGATYRLAPRYAAPDASAAAQSAEPASPVVPSVTASAPLPSAYVNVPIVDLQPDPLRGAADSGRAIASVSADAELVTLILNSDNRDSPGPYTLNVIDGQGRSIWRSEALEQSRYHTFTIALSPRTFAPGLYRLELSPIAGARRVSRETYTLRVEPRSPEKQAR